MRDVTKAILFIASSGCAWRVFAGLHRARLFLYALRDSGLLATMNERPVMAAREIVGRQAQPIAGIIDSHPSGSSG